MPYQVKICGLTNLDDIATVQQAGADFGGVLVDIPQSIRSLSLEEAVPLFQQEDVPLAAVTLNKGVYENETIATQLVPFALQLHGHEPPKIIDQLKPSISCEIWKVLHLPERDASQEIDWPFFLRLMRDFIDVGVDRFIVDSTVQTKQATLLGGTGKTVDWNAAGTIAEESSIPVMIAGGLTPANVSNALSTAHPDGVDVSSGVEWDKGKKAPDKIYSFVSEVRSMSASAG